MQPQILGGYNISTYLMYLPIERALRQVIILTFTVQTAQLLRIDYKGTGLNVDFGKHNSGPGKSN